MYFIWPNKTTVLEVYPLDLLSGGTPATAQPDSTGAAHPVVESYETNVEYAFVGTLSWSISDHVSEKVNRGFAAFVSNVGEADRATTFPSAGHGGYLRGGATINHGDFLDGSSRWSSGGAETAYAQGAM